MKREAIGLLTGIFVLTIFVDLARAAEEERMPPPAAQEYGQAQYERGARGGGSPWCRQLADPSDPMLKSEGYGVSSCNDRARWPYRPWSSTVPRYHDPSSPMTSTLDWRGAGYDQRYDDHYDRRSHRYR